MTVSIASLYFMPTSLRRPLYGGVYDIPAVSKGSPHAFLNIIDAIQPEKQPFILGGGRIPITIHARDIATDYVKSNARNGLGMSEDCGPAIWIVRDSVPMLNPDGTPLLDVEKRAQYRPATEEEKSQMWAEDMATQTARQDRWCDWLISQGDILDADPEQKQRVWITPTMRVGAKYAGREGGWVDRSAARADANKMCQFCTKSIPTASVVCQFCQNVVDRAKYDVLTAKPAMAPPLKNKDQQPAA